MLHISVFQCILQYLHLRDLPKRILSYVEIFAFFFFFSNNKTIY